MKKIKKINWKGILKNQKKYMKTIYFDEKLIPLIECGAKTQTRRLLLNNKTYIKDNYLCATEVGLKVYCDLSIESKYAFDDVLLVENTNNSLQIKIKRIRVERFEDISYIDARSEGFATEELFLDEIERIYGVREGACFVYVFEVKRNEW